jgi:hypothetical protein
MTNNQFYLHSSPEGVIKLIEGDKMPVMKHWPEGTPMLTDYNVALQRAKDSAIIVQNAWNAVELIAAHDIIGPQPDTIYGPFSVGYEIKEVLSPGWVPTYNDPDNINGHPNAEPIQVAILYDDTPEKEESQGNQETLWSEVDKIFNTKWTYGMPDDVMQELKEKFTITRK